MTPQFLLDSNLLIYLLQGSVPHAAARLAACPQQAVVTSSICLAETLIGLTAFQAARLDDLLQQIDVLPFDAAAAEVYAQLPFKRRGFDRLIAAHALSCGLTIVTANTADFADIPGLSVEDWTQP